MLGGRFKKPEFFSISACISLHRMLCVVLSLGITIAL